MEAVSSSETLITTQPTQVYGITVHKKRIKTSNFVKTLDRIWARYTNITVRRETFENSNYASN